MPTPSGIGCSEGECAVCTPSTSRTSSPQLSASRMIWPGLYASVTWYSIQ